MAASWGCALKKERQVSSVQGDTLPEITLKAVVLGLALAVVLGAANAYLGLLAGMTVSASIPAAVVSMAVLRLFKRSNILENNLVQTAASSGEALAAGVIFTLPALIILRTWDHFDYWQTTLLGGLGGMLGVLFAVPLRRALVVEAKLAFPEGVATARVLEVGDRGGAGVGLIAIGGALGALSKLGQAGLGLWTEGVGAACRVGNSVACVATGLAPALAAVGFIVGINIAVLVFLGGAANWFVAIPLLAPWQPAEPEVTAAKWAEEVWSTQTRYIGVGAMIVGGLWAIARMWPSLARGIASGVAAYRRSRSGAGGVPRTERDAPMQWVGVALAASVVPLFFVFRNVVGSTAVAALMAVIMLAAGFLFSAVAAYMAGIVGSSNNPISGVTISTVLTTALLLLALGVGGAAGPAAAVLIGSVVCCAASMSGDNLQDFKTGHIVGSTPWKQQVMEAAGALVPAFVMAPILALLLAAYGIGEKTLAHPKPLRAPQATLMASVARGVFAKDLPWAMVAVGAGVAVGVIALDESLRSRGSRFRTPVLAVAVGIYLPLELGAAIFLGGIVAWAASRQRAGEGTKGHHRGVLFAAGLITGEAILGILLAIPIVLNNGKNPLDLKRGPYALPGVLLVLLVLYVLYLIATRPSRTEAPDEDR
ncbi:MAG: oligopeptide transporter, OPT family [Planctomycetes bacterium]|nr:oligopeptide transporter, OPT family [Planctomycetota bacterium]